MKTPTSYIVCSLLCCASTFGASQTILGWNNLGMHCMDSDYSVFSILPPYNTIEGQLIVAGQLVKSGISYAVTYEAVSDPEGSINTTSIGKGNFYQWVEPTYGAAIQPDNGLLSWPMPGALNIKRAMLFEKTNTPAPGAAAQVNWWRAEGIPITPYDDALNKNPYPLMRMVAWNGTTPIATNDIVLPVSDEMDCRMCHASGTEASARPAAGWVWSDNPERDYRLNILRLHDENALAASPALYARALAAYKFNPFGLYRSVTIDQRPVLCALCHVSEALGTAGFETIKPLTASVHSRHAQVQDPLLGSRLNDSANRAACYRCHPGATTKCLRGAMGAAIAADGTGLMQCQSCHGTMAQVGSVDRVGWFMEPNCQSCHTGTAVDNAGAVRFTSVFLDGSSQVRSVTNMTFATSPNTPAPGISLYRFSAGHGGLQCSACHGSTHAEFPSSHANDNVRNKSLQGHPGVMVECAACHAAMPNSGNGGPHGLHAIDQGWITGTDTVMKHADRISALGGVQTCRSCHGADYRGSELSRAQTTRSFSVTMDLATISFPVYKGAEIGCYNCHRGPFSSSPNTDAAPAISNLSTNTLNSEPISLTLGAAVNGTRWKILSQPANGSVGLHSNVATFFPAAGFVGTDTFTFAAYDGSKNSLRATGTVGVTQGPFSFGLRVKVPDAYPADWPAPFTCVVSVTNHAQTPVLQWSFGDGTSGIGGAVISHIYSTPGSYPWSVVGTLANVSVTNSGVIQITSPLALDVAAAGGELILSWKSMAGDAVLEATPGLTSPSWNWVTNTVVETGGTRAVRLPSCGTQFLRLRRIF